jgi:hypothetical protein
MSSPVPGGLLGELGARLKRSPVFVSVIGEREPGDLVELRPRARKVAGEGGDVHWREGAFDGADVDLQPRQWKGALLS